MSHDSFFPAQRDAAPVFAIDAGEEQAACREVRGFADALVAARDPLAPAPLRLVIAGLDEAAAAWVERWAEDTAQVRRSLSIRRALDGAEIAVVATLASHGYGVPTSLAIESVRAHAGAILRSGVHLRADIDAALAGSCDLDPEATEPS